MSTIYVVQENNKFNYADAERFGDIQFLTNREYSPLKNSLINRDILDEINTGMKDFDPDIDYLLLSGNPVMIGYVFHLALTGKGYVRLLQWDGIQGQYREVHFRV